MRGLRFVVAAALWLGARALQLSDTSECFGIVPELRDDAAVAAATAETHTAAILAELPEWLSFDCKLSLRNIVCLSQYGPSVEMEGGETFGMCRSVCERVSDKCRTFLKQAGDQLASVIDLDSCVDDASCTAGNYDVAFEDDEPQCPKPLVVPDRDDPSNPIPGTGCALPCLSFMYTDEEWDNFIATVRFFSFIGLSAGGYMILVSAYNLYHADEERKVGSFFVFLFSVACTCSAIGAVTLVVSGIKEHICKGNATVTGTDDAVCLAQGYLYLLGTMLVLASSFCQCVDLYLRVVLKERKTTIRWVRKFYAGFIAFVVLFPIVVVASNNAIGYESSVSIPSCWIMTEDNDWIKWVAYLVPVTVGYALIVLMMTHSIITMNTVFYQNRNSVITMTDRSSTGQLRGVQKFIRYNIRPLLFIFLVGFIGLFPAGVSYYYEDKSNIMSNASETFITCLLTIGATDPDGAHKACGEVPDERPHYKVMAAMLFEIACYGTLPLLIYGIKYPECGVLKKWSSTSSPPGVSTTKRANVTSNSAVVPASSASGATSVEMAEVSPKNTNDSVPNSSVV